MSTNQAELELTEDLRVTLSRGSQSIAVRLDRDDARAFGIALIDFAGTAPRAATTAVRTPRQRRTDHAR